MTLLLVFVAGLLAGLFLGTAALAAWILAASRNLTSTAARKDTNAHA